MAHTLQAPNKSGIWQDCRRPREAGLRQESMRMTGEVRLLQLESRVWAETGAVMQVGVGSASLAPSPNPHTPGLGGGALWVLEKGLFSGSYGKEGVK